MAKTSTQDELEKPAKVYQLNAVESKVDQALTLLNTLVIQTNGLITSSQLECAKKEIYDKMATDKTEIDLKYGPLKKNITWFSRAMIVEGIAIIGQGVLLFIVSRM